MNVRISVILMVQNEEEHLGRCLESVKEIADEIVIIDGFSTDRTEHINTGGCLRSYTCAGCR